MTTASFLLQAGPHGPHAGGPMGQHGGWLAGWGWGPGLFMAALTLLILFGVVLLVWRLAGRERRHEALRILEAQYARGKIDDEEFEARRERLTDGRSGPG